MLRRAPPVAVLAVAQWHRVPVLWSGSSSGALHDIAFVHCFVYSVRRGLRHNMLAFIGIVIVVYAVAVVIGV